MRKASLCSGIGGVDLAAEWAGMETVVFCEREPFPQRVLRKHWPDIPIIDDVHDFIRERVEALGIGRIDLISAGYPCQPFSYAGKRRIDCMQSATLSILFNFFRSCTPSKL
ncbi:DNA cytosine methyltransferase [Paenibacillaceae bacterium WGS1546]|uniref:DNA cytosine methyltransferase n=1 Tax=Cohnella sp. WGS1546 TaxID=3366810 RepID=UPI00372CFBCB